MTSTCAINRHTIFFCYLLVAIIVRVNYCDEFLFPVLKELLYKCDFDNEIKEQCIINSSFFGSGWFLSYDGLKKNNLDDICYNGIPVVIKSCACFFGQIGIGCYEDCKDHSTQFHKIDWKLFNKHLSPHHEVARKYNLLDGQFVVLSSGIKHANISLEYASQKRSTSSIIYKFMILPHQSSGKSRVELSTCFVQQEELKALFGSSFLHLQRGLSLVKHCKASNIPIQSVSTYKYEIFIPRSSVTSDSKYILAQWHGSADPNIFKDQSGCISMVRDEDRHNICSTGSCKQGMISNKYGARLNLHYQCCGYPPLSFHVNSGRFLVIARSDSRIFIPRGGCPLPRNRTHFLCPHHPQQQVRILLEMPFDEFPFDSWVKFEWKVKWSEYSFKMKSPHADPGLLTSNAWIQLRINERLFVDWVGPCGRNDQGRTPFFKIGLYNPSGSLQPLTYYMKRYEHNYTMPKDIRERWLRKKLKNLHVRKSSNRDFPNMNYYKKNKFKKISGKCKLHFAEQRSLTDVHKLNFHRLKEDRRSKQFVNTLIEILEEQNERISTLESELVRYRSKNCDDVIDE